MSSIPRQAGAETIRESHNQGLSNFPSGSFPTLLSTFLELLSPLLPYQAVDNRLTSFNYPARWGPTARRTTFFSTAPRPSFLFRRLLFLADHRSFGSVSTSRFWTMPLSGCSLSLLNFPKRLSPSSHVLPPTRAQSLPQPRPRTRALGTPGLFTPFRQYSYSPPPLSGKWVRPVTPSRAFSTTAMHLSSPSALMQIYLRGLSKPEAVGVLAVGGRPNVRNTLALSTTTRYANEEPGLLLAGRDPPQPIRWRISPLLVFPLKRLTLTLDPVVRSALLLQPRTVFGSGRRVPGLTRVFAFPFSWRDLVSEPSRR